MESSNILNKLPPDDVLSMENITYYEICKHIMDNYEEYRNHIVLPRQIRALRELSHTGLVDLAKECIGSKNLLFWKEIMAGYICNSNNVEIINYIMPDMPPEYALPLVKYTPDKVWDISSKISNGGTVVFNTIPTIRKDGDVGTGTLGGVIAEKIIINSFNNFDVAYADAINDRLKKAGYRNGISLYTHFSISDLPNYSSTSKKMEDVVAALKYVDIKVSSIIDNRGNSRRGKSQEMIDHDGLMFTILCLQEGLVNIKNVDKTIISDLLSYMSFKHTYIASNRNTTFKNGIPKKYQTSKDRSVMSDIVEELLRIGRYDIIKNEVIPSKSAAFNHGMLTNNDYVRSISNMDMTMLEKMVELLDRPVNNNNITVDNDISIISRYDGTLTLENSTSITGQHLALAYRYYVSNNHSTAGFDYIRDKLRHNTELIKTVNAIDLRFSDWNASMMPTQFEESMAILSEELCKTIMLFPNIQHIYTHINSKAPVEKDLHNSSLEIFLAKLHNTKRFDFVKMLHPSALWTIVKSELFEKYVKDKSIIPVLHTILV